MPPPADVDLKDCILFVQRTLEQQRRVTRQSRFQDVLELWVEDCADEPHTNLDRIAEFVGQPLRLSADMPKISPMPKFSVHNRAQMETTFSSLVDGVMTIGA